MPLASQEVGPLPALQATAMLGLCPLHCAPSAGGRRAGDREEPGSQAALCLWAISKNRGLRPVWEPLAAQPVPFFPITIFYRLHSTT